MHKVVVLSIKLYGIQKLNEVLTIVLFWMCLNITTKNLLEPFRMQWSIAIRRGTFFGHLGCMCPRTHTQKSIDG